MKWLRLRQPKRFTQAQIEAYMMAALEAAKSAQKNGGVPIGAVLVSNYSGEIAATGGSLVHAQHDPSAHAEINAIRELSHRLRRDDLYNYSLFSTLEPCHMCLSAAAWARIHRVYYGVSRRMVDASLFDVRTSQTDVYIARKLNLRERLRMKVHGGILEDECRQLLMHYHDTAKHS